MKEKVRLNDGGLSVEIEYDFRIVVTKSQFSIINSKSKASRQFLEKSMVGFNLCHLMSVGLDLHRVDTFNVFTNSVINVNKFLNLNEESLLSVDKYIPFT